MASSIQIRNNFFYLDGQRWSPKGICYQPQDGVDPLSDDQFSTIQALVEGNWKTLGINAIRVYQVDPTKPHDQVMSLLAANQIYVEIGAVTGDTAINSASPQYTFAFLNRIKSVADAFAQYDNVLYFSIANEAIAPGPNNSTLGHAIPSIVKAGARDLRAYMTQKGYRAIPIGCAERDAPPYTIQAAAAYMCGSPQERLDILGYNCYRWAGGDLIGHLTAYYGLYQSFLFNNATPVIPVIMTEYGANTIQPRPFDDVPYLFGIKPVVTNGKDSVNMADIFSGGFVFRYQEDGNHFGLVDTTGQPTSFGGFANLQSAYQAITGFPAGSPNTTGSLDCSALGTNPYNLALPATPGGGGSGLPTELSVTVTNEISPATSIQLSCLVNDTWTSVLTMTQGQAATGTKIPAGTTQVQVVFRSTQDGQWYQACGVAQPLSLQNGATIRGTWQGPDGQGACQISG
ncbi:glycoside hydrolase family protein [Spirosoma validum]|uniref:Uncharacterized protein n=1 Tax=Spirosoma validum TaxID=2771355 RepID=A0A927B7H7_9BACT|nr:hypothetical protein [Spirosoma validum]MBD2757146.1 hypothetical protein [Spirosoma validum]